MRGSVRTRRATKQNKIELNFSRIICIVDATIIQEIMRTNTIVTLSFLFKVTLILAGTRDGQ